jgi:predicted ArsR family transcriptional regulator
MQRKRTAVSAKAKKVSRKTADSGIDVGLVKAISHPDRLEALKILNERVASPNELAKELGCENNYIAYHIRELAKYDCIELVRTEPRRGATEHFYRATKRPHFRDEEWLLIPKSLRNQLLRQSLEGMATAIGDSIDSDKFESREDRHFAYVPAKVDEQGWHEAMDLMSESLERFYAIVAASQERATDSEEGLFPMAFTMLGFEMGDDEVAASD